MSRRTRRPRRYHGPRYWRFGSELGNGRVALIPSCPEALSTYRLARIHRFVGGAR